METILTLQQNQLLEQLQKDIPYFIEYTREIILQVVTWDMDIEEMLRQVDYTREVASFDSQKRDDIYEWGSLGRLAMYEAPNEIQYFIPERDKCVEILKSLWIS